MKTTQQVLVKQNLLKVRELVQMKRIGTDEKMNYFDRCTRRMTEIFFCTCPIHIEGADSGLSGLDLSLYLYLSLYVYLYCTCSIHIEGADSGLP